MLPTFKSCCLSDFILALCHQNVPESLGDIVGCPVGMGGGGQVGGANLTMLGRAGTTTMDAAHGRASE